MVKNKTNGIDALSHSSQVVEK